MKLTSREVTFINHVKIVSKIYNIRCDLRKSKYVIADNTKCFGWFEDNTSLVVATGSKDWLGTLVHEYCHLLQFIEKTEVYKKGGLSLLKLVEWLEGRYVKNINKHIDNIIQMELDNEKRSVQVIRKFKLSIDINDYTKKANAYIHFYNWIKKNRMWPSPSVAFFNNEKIISSMSNKFNMRYDRLSTKIQKIVRTEKI